MDFLYQGIPLGRLFGTRITLAFSHIIMLFFIASGYRDWGPLGMAIVGLSFFLSILLHEFGHVFACRTVGGNAEQVILGPMGGLAQVEAPNRPWPQFVTTAGGPAVNALLWAACWGLLQMPALLQFVRGNPSVGIHLVEFLVVMVSVNKLLLVFNLFPIFPMDGGRLLQHILWPIAGYRQSLQITGMVGTVGGVGLIVLGTGAWSIHIPYVDMTLGGDNDYFLLFIGITCAMASWGLYQRSHEIDTWRKN